MFKRLAEFRLFPSWGAAPGLQGALPAREALPAQGALRAQEALPANDNLPNVLRPGGAQRIRSRALVCHWSLIDGGTRLSCRWSPEAPTPTAPEDRKRTNHQIFRLPAAAVRGADGRTESCMARRSFTASARLHITVFEPSYQKGDCRSGAHVTRQCDTTTSPASLVAIENDLQ
jgi:hypothetical protein